MSSVRLQRSAVLCRGSLALNAVWLGINFRHVMMPGMRFGGFKFGGVSGLSING